MAEAFPHKTWADPALRREYDEAVAKVKEVKPDAAVPSHLDMRGHEHVMGLLGEMEAQAEMPETPVTEMVEAAPEMEDDAE